MMKIRVDWPYESYDFGQGIPVILRTGTEITDEQFDTILSIIAALVPKERPRIRLVGNIPPDPIPPELQYATQAWVTDRLEGVVGGGQYVHDQTSPSAQWVINHNTGRIPSVVAMPDSLPGESVLTDVLYSDENTLIIEWPSPESGKAFLT